MTRAELQSVGAEAAACHLRAAIRLMVCAAGTLLLAVREPALAADIKIWPLVDYHRGVDGVELDVLGPLFRYRRTADEVVVAVRPLLHWRRKAGPFGNEASVLYPLAVSRWDEERESTRLLGLISWQTESVPRQADRERRFTIFPLVFYREHEDRGRSLSVLPVYADLRDFLGFQRIRMVAFPLFLRLEDGLSRRSWLPFPFFSWSGGETGRGWRVWPLYGWHEDGAARRSRFVLWPLYMRAEINPSRPEREVRVVSFPFYARVDGPTSRAWALLGTGLTHTVDRRANTETWGFPWPLWLSRRELDSGRRLTLRLAPFYQIRRQGDLRAQFYMWPLYRHEIQEAEDYVYERHDAGLVVWRRIEQSGAEGRRRLRHTLFPLWSIEEAEDASRGQTLGLLDALAPTNEIVRQVYSPLWRLYGYDEAVGRRRRWDLGWGLLDHDGSRLRYPVHIDLGE